MCESTDVSRSARGPVPRPRWGHLYGAVFLGVAGLAVADLAAPAVARPSLELLLALATFVAAALWVRGSRAALDQHAWCECAADTVTVRAISARRTVRASEGTGLGIAAVVGPEAVTPVRAASIGSSMRPDRPAGHAIGRSAGRGLNG